MERLTFNLDSIMDHSDFKEDSAFCLMIRILRSVPDS